MNRGRRSIGILALACGLSGGVEDIAEGVRAVIGGGMCGVSGSWIHAQEPSPPVGPQRVPGPPGNRPGDGPGVPGNVPGGGPGGFPGGPGGFPGGGPGDFPGGPGGVPRGGPGGFPGGQEMKVRERFDANQDGYLDRDERREARAQLAQERPAGGGRGGMMGRGPGGGVPGGFPGPGGGFPGPGGGFPGGGGGFPGGGFPGGPGAFPAGPPTQMLAGHLLRQADKDQDGKLSAVELTTFWDQLLRAHDQDRDAKLDEAEMAMLLEKILPAPGLGAGVGGGPPGG
ncbi:MAG: hypothetical protein ACKPEY_13460, partial [Planctomycetota bacterium]